MLILLFGTFRSTIMTMATGVLLAWGGAAGIGAWFHNLIGG